MRVDQLAPADDDAGLRAAQQLVAAEGDEVGAAADAFGDDRLLRQAVGRQVDERAAAEILHDRDAARAADRDERFQRHVAGEADDAVVRGVHLEQQRRLRR